VPFPAPELAAAAARERADGVTDMSTEKADSPLLRWPQVIEIAQRGNASPPRRVEKTDAQWRAALTDEQYHVARGKGTERAFSSQMCSLFDPGRYDCVCCGTPLFDSNTKFESRTGWPSFTAPLTQDVVAYHLDTSHGMQRIEATCNVCDAHLGHVFPDGPPPSGLRFCINALSLRKEKQG
jgi:peptide-methionine (R)-S-oxide reductase